MFSHDLERMPDREQQPDQRGALGPVAGCTATFAIRPLNILLHSPCAPIPGRQGIPPNPNRLLRELTWIMSWIGRKRTRHCNQAFADPL